MTIPYTYLIGWKLYNKFYYGVRFAAGCTPSDLMVTYFTSSKVVQKMITEYGLPDIIKIRKQFDNSNSARSWENKVLRRLKVIESEGWINKTNNKAIQPMPGTLNPMYGKIGELSPRFGTAHSDNTKKIIGEKSKLKRGNMPPGFSEKMRQIVTGRKHNEETKRKISENLSGREFTSEHKESIKKNHADASGINNGFFGKSHSANQREEWSNMRKGKVWVNNTIQRKLIVKEDLDYFINAGWKKGRGNK